MTIGASEAETFWTEFLRALTRRGLRGVKLVTPMTTCRSFDAVGPCRSSRLTRKAHRPTGKFDRQMAAFRKTPAQDCSDKTQAPTFDPPK